MLNCALRKWVIVANEFFEWDLIWNFTNTVIYIENIFSASTKKRKTPPSRNIQPRKPAQFRSTLKGAANLLTNLKFRAEHIVALRKTPFWHLIDAFIGKRVRSTRKFDIVTE